MNKKLEEAPLTFISGEIRTGPGAIQNLSIDCVIFGFHQGRLKVLCVKYAMGEHAGRWALPGGWLHKDESIDDSAARHLRDLTGLEDIYLEQLQAFGSIDRVPGQRIVTIAYYALVRPEDYELIIGYTTDDVQWRDVEETSGLIFDHDQILHCALDSLRHKVRHEPIGFNLLPKKFTLLQLQELYEAILDVKLDKPNFRRKMIKMKLLVPSGEKQQHVAHRAAELYRFDEEIYKRLCEQGFTFEV
ncbi:NUDIX domain-containing protein [Saccharophagus sp. K07]|uniref:NUDIX hydrolase n=1 Tax=Saccharophagus sp. K07 TaxID=2283636 RepID=UPI0021053851|nr:NUDIX domain-containing protein [Saccharophagus sp. K07]